MLQTSHDADANTLYWYFSEIEAGSTEFEAECAATLLCDDAGQVVGVAVTLDPDDALRIPDLPQLRYDPATQRLTVLLDGAQVASEHALAAPATLDIAVDNQIQGCEVLLEDDFASKLALLAALMVEVEAEEELPPFALPIFAPPAPTMRSGFVALVGRPNVGKSTLLNAILGQKVAIVSPRPQTTRTAIRGILTRPDAQLVFVDTPGIHEPRNRLGSYMVDQARRTIPDADIVCFVVDITDAPRRLDNRIAQLVQHSRAPKLLVLNKIDEPNSYGAENLAAYRALGPWEMEIAISAREGEGVAALVEELVRLLPVGGQMYPADQVTDQSEREIVAELVREQVLRRIEQEVPHGVAIEIEEWEERERVTYVRATIYVEKESQKGILIGAGGLMLKEIGAGARRNAEITLARPIYLDLWVKPRDNWRDDPSSLYWLGYRNRE